MKTGKIYKSLINVALSLIILGCNKDDSNNIPSAFEITVSEISLTSAKVTWTPSTTAEPTNLLYQITLNDSLIVENLDETSYDLSQLENSTNYTLVIKAINEYGTTVATKSFETLQFVDLQLKNYNRNDYYEFMLTYNEDGLLIYRGDPRPFPNGYTNVDYTYKQNNEILTEYSRYSDATGGPSGLLNYQYSNNMLTELYIKETGEDFLNNYEFQFITPLNYSYEHRHINFNSGQSPPDTTYYNYTVILEQDTDENIRRYTRTNTETLTVNIIQFEYANKNLTKITDGGNVFEITYDNSNNWHTYRSGFMPYVYFYTAADIGGFFYLPNLIRTWLRDIPDFFDFNNTNNPLEYKFNGQILTSFQYEYNQFNYPSKIIIPQQSDTIELEYEEIE